jgi:hypothetical protein
MAEPNHGLHHQIMWHLQSSEILHSVTWYSMVIRYQRFGTTYGSRVKGQEIQMTEHSTAEVSWHSLLFWDCVHCLIFK